MKKLKYILTVAAMLLLFGRAEAQKEVSSYNGESQIIDPVSVTLKDGFYAPAGSNLRVFTGQSYQVCNPFSAAPSSNQNYISTKVFKLAGVLNDTQANQTGRTTCEVNQTIQYFDGLGRPLQTVQVQASPSFKDIVQPLEYDAFGREVKKYQPYTGSSNGGAYRPAAVSEVLGFYASPPTGIKDTPSPFGVTVFEPSPLNRVQKQGFPGVDWQPATTGDDHTVKTVYGTNVANEVKLWTVTGNTATATTYPQGKLYKTILKDENWKEADGKAGTTEEFKDFEGRVVLKKVWETNAKSLSTYYVYDDLGNLRYVLPPAVNENSDRGAEIASFDENLPVFNDFIYGYHYDGRKRVTEKKVPGKGWEYLIYNQLDQVVMNQDAVQREKSPQHWNFTKYDAFGRVVLTGRYVDALHTEAHTNFREYFQGQANSAAAYEERDASNTITGYSNNAFPQNGVADYYTQNYYDDYDFPGIGSNQPATGQAAGGRVKGLLTGSKVKNLGDGAMLLTVNYYDLEGRVVQVKSDNHRAGKDIVDNTYSFIGELTASTRTHTGAANGAATTIANRYEYDHVGRKLATFENINSQGEVALSHLEYNEIGQLKNKYLHNDIQHTALAYNEQGWLKSSTSNEFSINLKYNEGSYPQYNGNIAGQDYVNGTANSFSYQYDGLERLFKATAGNSLGEELSYDVMGNIKTLTRDGFGTINYPNYTGNKLDNVSGYINSAYTYDANGNQKSDTGKGISNIEYNQLNLPIQITGPNVTFTYDASGTKLRKQSAAGMVDYIDGVHYKTDGTIDFIQTEEGVARRVGSSYNYEYNLSDHLGNVRATFYINPTTQQLEVIQRDDYYAFGLRKMNSPNANTNKYLYNGKELQEELGQYDYGARFYDPVIGRWNVVDPLVELNQENTSPYAYVLNNPIKLTDPDGRYPDGPGDEYDPEGATNFGMMIGGLIVQAGRSLKTLAYNAGAGLGITPNKPGMKWEATEVYSGGEYSTKMVEVPRQGVLKDIAGHAVDGLSVAAPLAMMSKGTTGTFFAKTNGEKVTATEIAKDIVKADNLAGKKYTITEVKNALSKVHEEVGSLPKGKVGKFGSPQRGTSQKGYRLDSEGHPNTTNPFEKGPHINFWDYTKGKRGSGGKSGAFPIE